MRLPFDIARCVGYKNNDEIWRNNCEHCLRRTEKGHPIYKPWIIPPETIVVSCAYKIDPNYAKD